MTMIKRYVIQTTHHFYLLNKWYQSKLKKYNPNQILYFYR